MAFVLGGVRSQENTKAKAKAKRGVARASLREVRLVGIGGEGTGPAPEGTWASGGRVTWSGRAYRVEATQDRAAGGAGPMRYVHLSSLAEG